MDELVPCGIDNMELYLKFKVGAKQLQGTLQEGFQLLRPVDVELRRASQQTHGADEAWKPQAVVAVGMGYEDVSDAFHAQSQPCKAHLRALAAVYHKQFAAGGEHLAGWTMPLCGIGTSAAKYV